MVAIKDIEMPKSCKEGMKVKDLELGRLFVATEPYNKHEDFYMKIQCSYEGANAVRLRDGIAIQLNAFTDVTELGVDIVEYLKETL